MLPTACARTSTGSSSAYRQANYDSNRSFFDDRFDLNQALSQFQAGHLDASGLWSARGIAPVPPSLG